MGKLIISMAITIFSPWEVVLWTPWHYLGDLVSTDVSRVASLSRRRKNDMGRMGFSNGKTIEKPWKNNGKTMGWAIGMVLCGRLQLGIALVDLVAHPAENPKKSEKTICFCRVATHPFV